MEGRKYYMMQNERTNYIDLLRIVAMLAVIMNHAMGLYYLDIQGG